MQLNIAIRVCGYASGHKLAGGTEHEPELAKDVSLDPFLLLRVRPHEILTHIASLEIRIDAAIIYEFASLSLAFNRLLHTLSVIGLPVGDIDAQTNFRLLEKRQCAQGIRLDAIRGARGIDKHSRYTNSRLRTPRSHPRCRARSPKRALQPPREQSSPPHECDSC